MHNKLLYIKFVYRFIHGNLYKCGDRSFHLDFPRVHLLFVHDHATKVDILFRDQYPCTIWIDKHGNIICRMLQPNKQTKLDF